MTTSMPTHRTGVSAPSAQEQEEAKAVLMAKWAALAAPFADDEVERLPKPFSKDSPKGTCNERNKDRNGYFCGGYHGLPAIHLDYVGHAGVTGRLNSVDPGWAWAPMFRDVNPEVVARITDPEVMRQYVANAPMLRTDGGLWINLTVLGVTRPGFGDAAGKTGPNATKELIGDALRNAAMRFGVATYLWSKSDKAKAVLQRTEGVDVDDDQQAAPSQREPEQAEARSARTRPDPITSIRAQIAQFAAKNSISVEDVGARYLRRFGRALPEETSPANLTVFYGEYQKDLKVRAATRRWMKDNGFTAAQAQDRYESEFGYGSAEEVDPKLLEAFLKDWQDEVANQRGQA